MSDDKCGEVFARYYAIPEFREVLEWEQAYERYQGYSPVRRHLAGKPKAEPEIGGFDPWAAGMAADRVGLKPNAGQLGLLRKYHADYDVAWKLDNGEDVPEEVMAASLETEPQEEDEGAAQQEPSVEGTEAQQEPPVEGAAAAMPAQSGEVTPAPETSECLESESEASDAEPREDTEPTDGNEGRAEVSETEGMGNDSPSQDSTGPSLEEQVKLLGDLRASGALGDEDYRKMVLELVSSKEKARGDQVPQGKGQAKKAATPASPNSAVTQITPRLPVPSASKGDGDQGKMRNPHLVAAVVVVALVALGFLSGIIAFKPADVSQEYWDAGRRALFIGRWHQLGLDTTGMAYADVLSTELIGDPSDQLHDPYMDEKVETNDARIEDAIKTLESSLEYCEENKNTMNTADSARMISEALDHLDRATRAVS